MFQKEITKEEVAGLDLIEYEGPISVIDSVETFEAAIGEINDQALFGFDTETRRLTPATMPTTSSIGRETNASTSDGAAPGRRVSTVRLGYVRSGSRLIDRRPNATRPKRTIATATIEMVTRRRRENSTSCMMVDPLA